MFNLLNQSPELFLLIAAGLLFLSVVASKISDRFGIPALLLFLVLGMLAGSEGIGGIHFNDPFLARSLGIIALIFILFAGGVETKFEDIRTVIGPGILLSTAGVLLTALIVGLFATVVLKFSLLQGMLLGAIISSTDAPTVFSILRSNNVNLKGRLRALLELESGSNDPMAVFLTLGLIRLLTVEDFKIWYLVPQFLIEILVAVGMAYLMSKVILFIINRLQLAYEGLYPVLTISLIILTYALTVVLKGNGFLAVYLVSLILGNSEFLHKKVLIHFHGGLAWLMQIVMFLALGLLVFPSQIIPFMGVGLLIAVFLMIVARPLSVFICLLFNRMNINEKLMISWVGLRGAVPIILAIFPMTAGIPNAEMIFNIVFFIVLTSILLQGTSVPWVSRLLKVDVPFKAKRSYPLAFEQTGDIDASLEELIVPFNSEVAGKKIFEIGLPMECLIALLGRDDKFFIPSGATVLEEGDVLMVLASKENISRLQSILNRQRPAGS